MFGLEVDHLQRAQGTGGEGSEEKMISKMKIRISIRSAVAFICISVDRLIGGTRAAGQGTPRWGQDIRDPLNQMDEIDHFRIASLAPVSSDG